ncbi:hypothetical protein SAMN05428944_0401 [Streptomyces sp. 1222.5]|uniref:CU044_5270 family protein n=1 Tax=unclassified Streptomyces TaxID=2593676 RepID=UPI000894DBC4|nr:MULTISPECIES: CU044_5270 family protein [unclassified Streptomyces]PKW12344.1 hypothetical protein BX260_7695 [Streptomyces sp. 5112.2]SEB57992.1 hypothetical protein SAMN05428944_0401 [Streptomyces sp. 1222.5]
MDDMTLLQQMRAEVPRPDPARLAIGRERLLAEIRQEPSNSPAPRRTAGSVLGRRNRGVGASASAGTVRPRLLGRPVIRAALATVVVAAITSGVVTVVDATSREDRHAAAPGADSPRMRAVSASTVLKAAAAHQRRQEKQIAPRDDQFIYTKELVTETEIKTGKTRTLVDENWHSVDGTKRGWTMEVGKGWWAEPLKPNQSMWPPAKWQELEKLPTEPFKLILFVQKRLIGRKPTPTPDIRDHDWPMIEFGLVNLLHRRPVMPPGLRAAAFEALGMIPGVTATPGVTDADGRPGIAIAYKDPFHQLPTSDVLIFADDTYDFLGFEDSHVGERRAYKRIFTLESYAIVDKVKQRP